MKEVAGKKDTAAKATDEANAKIAESEDAEKEAASKKAEADALNAKANKTEQEKAVAA